MTERDDDRSGLGRDIPGEALRDVATPELVERVWLRLDGSIEPARMRSSRSSMFMWAVAASVSTFVVGVGVGQRFGSTAPEPRVAVFAEPRQDLAPASIGDGRLDVAEPRAVEQTAPPRSRTVRARRKFHAAEPVSTLAEESTPDLPDVETEIVEVVPETEVAPVLAPPNWQRLANAGEYEAALFELGQEGGFEGVLLDANAEQLMLLADVARATGQSQRALAALRRIVAEFRDDPVAPLAAFSLGNLLEKGGEAREAARAFAVYRALSPEGDFAEDALVRQIRSAVERGDRDVAEQLVAQYQAGFPDGRRAEEIERWVEELVEHEAMVVADAGAASPDSDQGPEADDGEQSGAPAPEAQQAETGEAAEGAQP